MSCSWRWAKSRYCWVELGRLRIGVEQLGADGFRLEFEGIDGAPNVIALAPGGGIHGRYERDDDTTGLHGL
ncbi:MAG: hypothetical protein K0V04_31820, partial [Deltaproteobacteria bacterium]|nr:hypothetical protein [Deltaproteobacteria bacterium]